MCNMIGDLFTSRKQLRDIKQMRKKAFNWRKFVGKCLSSIAGCLCRMFRYNSSLLRARLKDETGRNAWIMSGLVGEWRKVFINKQRSRGKVEASIKKPRNFLNLQWNLSWIGCGQSNSMTREAKSSKLRLNCEFLVKAQLWKRPKAVAWHVPCLFMFCPFILNDLCFCGPPQWLCERKTFVQRERGEKRNENKVKLGQNINCKVSLCAYLVTMPGER